MKLARTLPLALALLLLATFVTPEAWALQDCGNENICNCGQPCSTRCTPSPFLPLLTCGDWGYDCSSSPNCDFSFSASSTMSEEEFLVLLSTPAEASTQN